MTLERAIGSVDRRSLGPRGHPPASAAVLRPPKYQDSFLDDYWGAWEDASTLRHHEGSSPDAGAVTLNGRAVVMDVANRTCSWTCPRHVRLSGAKRFCEVQVCGRARPADGAPVSSCTVLAADVEGPAPDLEGLRETDAIEAITDAFERHGRSSAASAPRRWRYHPLAPGAWGAGGRAIIRRGLRATCAAARAIGDLAAAADPRGDAPRRPGRAQPGEARR